MYKALFIILLSNIYCVIGCEYEYEQRKNDIYARAQQDSSETTQDQRVQSIYTDDEDEYDSITDSPVEHEPYTKPSIYNRKASYYIHLKTSPKQFEENSVQKIHLLDLKILEFIDKLGIEDERNINKDIEEFYSTGCACTILDDKYSKNSFGHFQSGLINIIIKPCKELKINDLHLQSVSDMSEYCALNLLVFGIQLNDIKYLKFSKILYQYLDVDFSINAQDTPFLDDITEVDKIIENIQNNNLKRINVKFVIDNSMPKTK